MAALLPSTARTLLARTARVQAEGRAPSLVAGVMRDGELVWSAGRGAVDEPHHDVQYRLGSISKTITAITVLRLRDEGRLDLDDPLEKHLHRHPVRRQDDRPAPRAPRRGRRGEPRAVVGTHTRHHVWTSSGSPTTDVVLPAARRFHYSNLGFGLLGELVAAARGRAWADVASDEVLAPLGMTTHDTAPVGPGRAGLRRAPVGRRSAGRAGARRGGDGAGGPALGDRGRPGPARRRSCSATPEGSCRPDTVEEMTVPAGIDSSAPTWMAYGLGVQVQRPPDAPAGTVLVGHGGSMPGFLAGLWVDRAEGTGALMLANTTSGLDNGLTAGLLADVRAAEPRIVDAWTPSASPVPVELLGPWFWGPAPYVLRAVPGGLLHLGGLGRPGRSSRFRPGPDGTWVGMDGYFAGETLRLDGVALNLATFVFTRTPYDGERPGPRRGRGGGLDARTVRRAQER